MANTSDFEMTSAEGRGRSTSAMNSIYRKIAWRTLPFIMTLWVLAWLDRVNVSFAKLQMMDDLHLSEAVYGLGAGIFYIGYLLFEVPSNLLLQRIGARKTIARITIGWGLLCMLTAFVTTPMQFYVVRFLLGAFEAGFYPGIILYLTMWFPSNQRAKIFGIFMSAAALSGVVGGPLASLFMTNFDGIGGFHGWQWVFVGEGLPSVIGGIVAIFYLTDSPVHAHWLSASQRGMLLADLQRDAALHSHRETSLRAALRDSRLWTFTVIYFCVIFGNATAAFWGPSVAKEITGAPLSQVGWIVSAASLLGATFMVLNGYWSDRNRNPRLCSVASLLMSAIAFLTLALVWKESPIVALVAFSFAYAGAVATLPAFWQMPNAVFTGTAAAAGIAVINSFGNLGGFVAPYALGLIKESTGRLTPGLLCAAAFMALASVLIVVIVPKKQ